VDDLRAVPITTGAQITALRMLRAVLAGGPVPVPDAREMLPVLRALTEQAVGRVIAETAATGIGMDEAEAAIVTYIDGQLASLILGEGLAVPGGEPWMPGEPPPPWAQGDGDER
jgi:hypothetical protein